MFQTTNESTTGRVFCLRIKLNQHPMDGTRLYSNPLLYHPALGSELLREAQLAGRTASLFTPDRLRHGAARPICTLQCASSSYQISGRQSTKGRGQDGGNKSELPSPNWNKFVFTRLARKVRRVSACNSVDRGTPNFTLPK